MGNDFKFYPRQRYEFLKNREEDIVIEEKEVESEEEQQPVKILSNKTKKKCRSSAK